jgi:amino acid transporter
MILPAAGPSVPLADAGLVRAIGARQLTASIVNTTIGAGIFVLPALVAAETGRAAPFAYLVCAAAMGLVVTSIAAAGSRVSLTGGLYAYTEIAFGPYVGFLAGLLYWLGACFAVASVASALAGSAGVLVPAVASGPGRATLLIALFGSLALINVRGVVPGIRLVEAITVAKLVPLLIFVAGGLWFVSPGTLTSMPPLAGSSELGRAGVVLIFAFAGLEVALVPTGEVREPSRTVPRALFGALAITTLMYLLIQTVAQGLLGDSLPSFTDAPLAEAASRMFGSAGRVLVVAGAAVSMTGYVTGDALGTPRSLFAFGRDGFLPSALASVHPRFRTPWIAIIVHATIVCSLALTSTFGQLAVLANVATLLLYLLCVAASAELQRRDVRCGGAPFVLPAGVLIPLLAAAVIVWLLAHATLSEFAATAVVLAAGTIAYAIRGAVRRSASRQRAPASR